MGTSGLFCSLCYHVMEGCVVVAGAAALGDGLNSAPVLGRRAGCRLCRRLILHLFHCSVGSAFISKSHSTGVLNRDVCGWWGNKNKIVNRRKAGIMCWKLNVLSLCKLGSHCLQWHYTAAVQARHQVCCTAEVIPPCCLQPSAPSSGDVHALCCYVFPASFVSCCGRLAVGPVLHLMPTWVALAAGAEACFCCPAAQTSLLVEPKAMGWKGLGAPAVLQLHCGQLAAAFCALHVFVCKNNKYCKKWRGSDSSPPIGCCSVCYCMFWFVLWINCFPLFPNILFPVNAVSLHSGI